MKPFIISVVLFTTLLHVQAFPKKIEYGGRVDKSLLFLNHSAPTRTGTRKCYVPDPTLPCVVEAPPHGWTLGLKGIPTGSRFTIDLLNKRNRSDSADILYQFGVRLNYKSDKNIIVQNSRIGGRWGRRQERQYDEADFPFPQDQKFTLTMTRSADEIRVVANDKHVVTWKKEIPFPDIKWVYIWHDLDIKKIF